jgi:hypothetical protein
MVTRAKKEKSKVKDRSWVEMIHRQIFPLSCIPWEKKGGSVFYLLTICLSFSLQTNRFKFASVLFLCWPWLSVPRSPLHTISFLCSFSLNCELSNGARDAGTVKQRKGQRWIKGAKVVRGKRHVLGCVTSWWKRLGGTGGSERDRQYFAALQPEGCTEFEMSCSFD